MERALIILGTKKHRAEVETAIESISLLRYRQRLGGANPHSWYKPNKDEKEQARKLGIALTNAYRLLGKLGKLKFHGDEDPEPFRTQVKRWQEKVAAFLKFDVGKPRRHDADDKHLAAELAYELMRLHKRPITRTRPDRSRGTRGSKFLQLAAILYGDEKTDLFESCRKVMNSRKPKIETGTGV